MTDKPKKENGIREVVYENGITIASKLSVNIKNADAIPRWIVPDVTDLHPVFEIIDAVREFAQEVLRDQGYPDDISALVPGIRPDDPGSLGKIAFRQLKLSQTEIRPVLEKYFSSPLQDLDDDSKELVDLVQNAYALGYMCQHLANKVDHEESILTGRKFRQRPKGTRKKDALANLMYAGIAELDDLGKPWTWRDLLEQVERNGSGVILNVNQEEEEIEWRRSSAGKIETTSFKRFRNRITYYKKAIQKNIQS